MKKKRKFRIRYKGKYYVLNQKGKDFLLNAARTIEMTVYITILLAMFYLLICFAGMFYEPEQPVSIPVQQQGE